jgi:hypothetical protein
MDENSREDMMNIKTCQYVEASEIFKSYDLAWDVFITSDPDCSWGDNDRTLVLPDVIIENLEHTDFEDNNEYRAVEQVVKILKNIPVDVYIDLEN